ncbi:hypothetical protein [Jeotgalibaca caeni]|uniref:hypothetical protein n=1 Tax=Jeotgalibaca caeni TaxID=3028623 RepID=UPI00237E5479|nr:hypothetical protein [Jeotgalibaca caeni]MDE1547873.1 hypothetical protein [Jeotgalibaca caeni]
MRYYIDENENHFYSNRMDRTFSFLSEYAQDLEMNENDGKIEITGVVSEINRDLFDAFWIDPHAYLYRYFYQPLHFSLLLEEDTNLPLQLTLQNTEGEKIEDDELLKQKSSFTLTFSGYNEAAYAFEIPTKEETLYAPNGFSDFEEAFVNDTTIAALPEIIEAPVDSGKLQLYESIITLPVTGQELLDLGFTPEIERTEDLIELVFRKEKLMLRATTAIPFEGTESPAEVEITGLSLDQEAIDTKEAPIYFPGGISLGTFLEDLDRIVSSPTLIELAGSDTFHEASSYFHEWRDEDPPLTFSLGYSVNPETKQVDYLRYNLYKP